MDHAARIVERLAVDREPRMLGLAEHSHQLGDGHRFLDGDDVGARDHDVLDRELAEAQHLEQHGALLPAEGVAGALGRGSGASSITSRKSGSSPRPKRASRRSSQDGSSSGD